jgi:peroxiredoxin
MMCSRGCSAETAAKGHLSLIGGRKKILEAAILFTAMVFATQASAQLKATDLAMLGNELRDFTLPVYQGGTFTLSDLRGRNVLLLFPRGYYDQDWWCDICAYQYFDLVSENEKQNLTKRFNLEIVVVLPYDTNTIARWLLDMPEVYRSLADWKFIKADTASEREKRWSLHVKEHFPREFDYKRGQVPTPFKILVDADHALSRRLDIFRTEWWGTKVDQNVPATILLNGEGRVVFKHISQHTLDRPSTEYLIRVMETFLVCPE